MHEYHYPNVIEITPLRHRITPDTFIDGITGVLPEIYNNPISEQTELPDVLETSQPPLSEVERCLSRLALFFPKFFD